MISNISSLCLSCCNCKFELAARDNVRRVLSNNSIGTTIVSNMSERFLTSILFLLALSSVETNPCITVLFISQQTLHGSFDQLRVWPLLTLLLSLSNGRVDLIISQVEV